MSESRSGKLKQISPDDLRAEMGWDKGDSLASIIAHLTPQVALWWMARQSSERDVLPTTSSRVIDVIRERYFSVRRKDLSWVVADFLEDAKDPEFNWGFSFSRLPAEEWPEGVSETERVYLLIRYPTKSSSRFQFAYSLNPESLGKVAEAAQKLGGSNSLALLYEDGKRMWEEGTGMELPDNHQTPEWFRAHFTKLYEAKNERKLREEQTLVREVWQHVKDYFDQTEGDPLKNDSIGRYAAVADLVWVYRLHPLLSDATTSSVTSFDTQRERDDRVLMDAVSASTSYESFLEEVDKGVAKRLEQERDYRRTINEVYVELHSLPLKKRWREMHNVLVSAKWLDWDDQVSKEIFWDQEELIEKVEAYFKRNKNRQEAMRLIQEDDCLSGQEITDLVKFFTT